MSSSPVFDYKNIFIMKTHESGSTLIDERFTTEVLIMPGIYQYIIMDLCGQDLHQYMGGHPLSSKIVLRVGI